MMEKRLMTEGEGYEILKKSGIPIPGYSLAKTPDEAVDIANKINYPVVMKIVSPQVIHKSDVGGVVIGINVQDTVRKAFNQIIESVKQKIPSAEITGIMVEKQMQPGLELIIGGKIDPSFGKIITFGMGGKLVELIKDFQIRVLPIDEPEIIRMVHSIKSYALIKGYRDNPPADEQALIEIIGRICDMYYNTPNITEFDINPLILYEKGACAVDARIYWTDVVTKADVKQERELDSQIFYPESIAVIGASGDPNKIGYSVFRNLLDFPGKLYPVNPKHEDILGRKAFNSLNDIPGNIDMVVVVTPSIYVADVLDEAGKKNVKLAVVISAGFKEIGGEGIVLEQKVDQVIQKYGMRMVGPNCLGLFLPHKKINATFDPVSPKPGRLAFISQSGAMITAVVDWGLQEEIGFSAVVSVGNQVDLGFDDFLKFSLDDIDTKAVILYIEEIKNGRLFMNVAKEISEKKHLIALKSGSSVKGQAAASSHTGSLAGSYEVYMAAFRQSCVIPALSITEAFQIGELLASENFPQGNRAIIITNAGGFAVLASDYAEKYGLNVIDLPQNILTQLNSFLTEEWSHKNPMDLVGDASVDRYARVFDIMIQNQDLWDVAFVISVPTAVLDPRQLAKEIVRFSKNTHKMTVAAMLGGNSVKAGVHVLRDAGVPNFPELKDAFRSVGKALSIKDDTDTSSW